MLRWCCLSGECLCCCWMNRCSLSHVSPQADVLILEGFISVQDGRMVGSGGNTDLWATKTASVSLKSSSYIQFDGLMRAVCANWIYIHTYIHTDPDVHKPWPQFLHDLGNFTTLLFYVPDGFAFKISFYFVRHTHKSMVILHFKISAFKA